MTVWRRRRWAPLTITKPYRLIFTLAVVQAAAGFMWFNRSAGISRGGDLSDLTPLVVGAQAWLNGLDPYAVVKYSMPSPLPLVYPFPAVLAFVPFANVPGVALNTVFVALSSGALAWVMTRDQHLSPRLLLFISPAFFYAVQMSQWSPLLMAATFTRWGGALFALKPTTAVWLWAYRPQLRSALLAMAVVGVSVIVWPTWPFSWLASLDSAEWTVSPLLLPGGPLALVALVRWRRPEARLLAVMACVPHTTVVYEALPLFLIPSTWAEGVVLLIGTVVARLAQIHFEPHATPLAATTTAGTWMIWCVYLPSVVMILRRPNVSVLAPLTDEPIGAKSRPRLNTRTDGESQRER